MRSDNPLNRKQHSLFLSLPKNIERLYFYPKMWSGVSSQSRKDIEFQSQSVWMQLMNIHIFCLQSKSSLLAHGAQTHFLLHIIIATNCGIIATCCNASRCIAMHFGGSLSHFQAPGLLSPPPEFVQSKKIKLKSSKNRSLFSFGHHRSGC